MLQVTMPRRGGIRALSEWLNENTDLEVTFIDIPNPA